MADYEVGHTFDGIVEWWMKLKLHLTDQITQILVIDTSHIADPLMGITLWFFAKWKSHRAINIWQNYSALRIHIILLQIYKTILYI